MTRTAHVTAPSFAMAALLPMLAFVAGLGTAQLITTDDLFAAQDATHVDHHRRGARSLPVTNDTASVPARADAAARPGKRAATAPDQVIAATQRPVTEPRVRLLVRQ